MLIDLFGEPVLPKADASKQQAKPFPRTLADKRAKFLKLVSSPKDAERLAAKIESGPTIPLFVDFLDYLKAPLVPKGLKVVQSDRGAVAIRVETGDEVDGEVEPQIPYEPWGVPWIESHGLKWSVEAISHLQVQVFWESMEELGLHNNEHEKWSVLKWILMPAIKKLYVYDKRINKSHCLPVHEREEPFSFRNCCIAARMDADELREMIRQRLPAEILEAVQKVVTF